ncbi:hypothetical protein ACFP51_25735 [Streptomyces pratens]|uniref:Cytochrome P450 n=1 Tax=Streptomyces pratens TaxID=887456 RepID=A0ABW1M9C7_9ACTN
MAAGNRDPRHYGDPDSFRVRRNPSDHLSFDYGTHGCAGHGLARLEAFAVIGAPARRVRRCTVGPGEPRISNSTRSLDPLTTLPHVVFDGPPQPPPPYAILDEWKIPYRVRGRVSDYLLIPHLVAGSGPAAMHRYRVRTALRDFLELRIEEFPLPVGGLGIDMIWNPWPSDDRLRTRLRGILIGAAASLEPGPPVRDRALRLPRDTPGHAPRVLTLGARGRRSRLRGARRRARHAVRPPGPTVRDGETAGDDRTG